MAETILAGRGREIVEIPREQWENNLAEAPERMKPRLDWMSERHHAVRYFVVEELARFGKPIPPDLISERMRIHLEDVFSDVILAAGQNHDRGQSKQIGGLVAVRERPEISFVVPERRGGFGEPKQNAKCGERDDARGEKSQRSAHSRFRLFRLRWTPT